MAGMFGMNLINHMEANPYTFYIISGSLFSSMGVIFYSVLRYGQKQRLF